MINYIKKLTKTDKILYSTFAISTILIMILCFVKPTMYSFTPISALANFFLILIVREVLKVLKIKFTKKELITMIIAIIAVYIFYIISISNRQFIYFADFSCYYNIQLATEEKFASGLLEGIRYFGGSTWSGEYGNFLSFFPEIIFRFTNRTTNSFILSYTLVFTPYVVLALSILIKKLIEKFKIKKEKTFFITSIITLLLFPLYHAMAIYGQPDFFGLAFIFLIIALTINYDFKKLEFDRLTLILLVTFMLTISRRWYIYWIITYFLCYVLKIFIDNIKNKSDLKIILKNILLYGTIVIIFFGLTLFPMIKNILFGSIGDYSAFYLTGGFPAEINSQINHLGYLTILLMMIGTIYGVKEKQFRTITLLSIIQYILAIFIFTRIQNMGRHHSLILVPTYLYWIYLSVLLIINTKGKMTLRYLTIIIAVLTINFAYGLCENGTENLFTKVPLVVSKEENYSEFMQVATWLKENINEKETAYMINHTNLYNPDKFRNVFMPDKTIYNYLPYGSAVIGSHYFPLGLFDAKYVLTTTPFDYISMEYKYNDVFNQLVEQGKFKQIEDFNMNNGYHFLVYERVKEVDENEKELYINALEEESKRFPELYENVIKNYTY